MTENGNGGGRPSSIWTSTGQAELRRAGAEQREKLKRAVDAAIERVNQRGCGLSATFSGEHPEGQVTFRLASDPNPRNALRGRLNGGLIVMFGQDWGTRHDLMSLMRNVVRDLALASEEKAAAFEEPRRTGPVASGSADSLSKGMPRIEGGVRGFKRHIDL